MFKAFLPSMFLLCVAMPGFADEGAERLFEEIISILEKMDRRIQRLEERVEVLESRRSSPGLAEAIQKPLASPSTSSPASREDIEALRKEIQILAQSLEKRIANLEQRMDALEKRYSNTDPKTSRPSPNLTGSIKKVAGNMAKINLGYLAGLSPGDDLPVYRRVGGNTYYVGHLRLGVVLAHDAAGLFDSHRLQVGDIVFLSPSSPFITPAPLPVSQPNTTWSESVANHYRAGHQAQARGDLAIAEHHFRAALAAHQGHPDDAAPLRVGLAQVLLLAR